MRLDGQLSADVAQAATLLAQGELVAWATETVYGLGARADDDRAVAKIFIAKGRPPHHPLIVHVAQPADAVLFAAELPPVAQRLISVFWPGPLTLIVPRIAAVAHSAAAGQNTVGLRCPAHPVAQALLLAVRGLGVAGVAAPSANRFGGVSPTRAEHVEAEFGGSLPVLDGGACTVGIESTIIDCSRGRPVLLRPGVLTLDQLEAAAGEALRDSDAQAPRAPGTLKAHYAPRAKLRLMPTPMLNTALQMLGTAVTSLALYSRTVSLTTSVVQRHLRMPMQPEQAARELFAAVRELDAEGIQLIWVEEPPAGPEWDGVRDRLLRAAAAA